MPNDRFHAVEAQTVRLYFRNYVSNVLTDVTSPIVQIKSKGSSTVLALFSGVAPSGDITKESTGVYYVDWSIPSSTVDSLKYSPTFPGPGDYQDVWKDGSTVILSQDFFVAEEGFPGSLAEIIEPIQLTHELANNRFEGGAKDFLIWRIRESNGKLVPGQSKFPDGEIRFIYGDQVIQNYSPLTHRESSNEYKYFIDTTSLQEGIYKAQSRFFIPAATVNNPAEIVTQKSLSNGFSSTSDSVLQLTIDGTDRTINFPTSATNASVQSTISSYNFFSAANDLFIVDVNGSEKRVRLVNTPAARTITDIIAELTGTVPAPYDGSSWPGGAPTGPNFSVSGLQFPLLTSSITHSVVPTGINGTNLSFSVDGVQYSLQFNNVNSIEDIVTQINNAYTASGDIVAFSTYLTSNVFAGSGGILVFGDYDATGITTISIDNGTALPLLGLVQGQDDDSTHSLAPASVVNDSGAIKITASTSLRILSGAEGSVANPGLDFSANGESDNGVGDLPATVTGSSIIYPLEVIEPTSAIVESTADLSDFEASGPPFVTSLDGTGFTLSLDGGGGTPISFADSYNPSAIVSPLSLGSYNVDGETLIIYNGATTSTTTFSGTNPISISEIISQINSQLSTDLVTNVLADSFNGHLRIRATTTGVTITMNHTATAFNTLGFNGVLTSPEVYYQNDQVVDGGSGDLEALQYTKPFTLSRIINVINTAVGSTVASLDGNKLVIKSTTTGSSSEVALSADSGALSQLNLPTSGTFNGLDGQNSNLDVTINAVLQTITFSAQAAKGLTTFVNEFNSQAEGAVAYDDGGQLKISTTSLGSSVSLTLASSDGAVSALGFGAISFPVNGTDAVSAEIIGGTTIGTAFASGGNAIFAVGFDGNNLVNVDLSGGGFASASDIATQINSDVGTSIASGTGNVLTIQSPSTGADSQIEVGGINDGSNANSTLGFNVDGAIVNGTNGQPYTLDQIIEKINAAYGGTIVADSTSNFLRLRSSDEGAGAEIIVRDGTSSSIVNNWGLPKGTFVGSSTTQVSQTIVSPRLTLIIGE